MGIYSDGDIYGIGWTVVDNSGEEIIRFERISNKNTLLSEDEILEIKAHYENFQNNIHHKKLYDSYIISYKIYTSCSSTYERGLNDIVFMKWFSVNRESLDKFFLLGKGPITI
jgi:hypothetical protein